MGLVLFLIFCLIGIVVLQVGFIFMMLALMPSIMAFFIDTDHKRSIFKVVGSANLAACLPTLVPMIGSAIRMRRYDIESVIADPMVWLFIYMGAAAGWALIYTSRFISRFVVTMSCEYNIANLKKQQKLLIDEWGDELTNNAYESTNEQ
jgi:nitrate reductase gamma subunit